MGRQQRFTYEEDHFKVDLVFYNRLLRCFVLFDLKPGKLTHQDIGQMQMYVHYYDRDKSLGGTLMGSYILATPGEIFRMKFNVIIGDPPHQPSDGGNDASAIPTYQKFVEQAKKLNPRPLVMIIPSRWFFGRRGLGAHRSGMPHDRRIEKLVGYRDAGERLPRRGPVRWCLLPPLGAGLRRRPHRREHEPWQGQRAPSRPRP